MNLDIHEQDRAEGQHIISESDETKKRTIVIHIGFNYYFVPFFVFSGWKGIACHRINGHHLVSERWDIENGDSVCDIDIEIVATWQRLAIPYIDLNFIGADISEGSRRNVKNEPG